MKKLFALFLFSVNIFYASVNYKPADFCFEKPGDTLKRKPIVLSNSEIKKLAKKFSICSPVDSTIRIFRTKSAIRVKYISNCSWIETDTSIHLPEWAVYGNSDIPDLNYQVNLKTTFMMSLKGDSLLTKTDTLYNYYTPVFTAGDSSVKVDFENGLSAEIESFSNNEKPIVLLDRPEGDSVGVLTKKMLLKSDMSCDYLGGELSFEYAHVIWPGRKEGYWICVQNGMFTHEFEEGIGNWSDLHSTLYLRKK